MSAVDITPDMFPAKFDLSLITGVAMYINDDELSKVLTTLNNLTTDIIYIQESVSLAQGRLTLNKFYSNDLKCNYSAIYRTIPEYAKMITDCCPDFEIKRQGLLLDRSNDKRSETNASYWVLKRKNFSNV